MRRAVLAAIIGALALAAGCGGDGGEDAPSDPAARVPTGIQAQVRAAQDPQASEFPDPAGKSLQALADEIGGGPEMGMASSVFVAGRPNRLAFGMIDQDAGFLYGKSAVYVARYAGGQGAGPVRGARRRAADRGALPLPAGGDGGRPVRRGVCGGGPAGPAGHVLRARRDAGRREAGRARRSRSRWWRPARTRSRRWASKAPRVQTDTVAAAGGDIEAIDTRRPTDDMHETSFADVVG